MSRIKDETIRAGKEAKRRGNEGHLLPFSEPRLGGRLALPKWVDGKRTGVVA